jgi:hypothetical protein
VLLDVAGVLGGLGAPVDVGVTDGDVLGDVVGPVPGADTE